MTMPKGFKPKGNKKEKREENAKGLTGKKDNNIDSNDIKVAAATTDDFTNKQENKIVTENISLTEVVTPGDLSIDEDAAIITTASATTSEMEVQPENQSKVPFQEKEKVISNIHLILQSRIQKNYYLMRCRRVKKHIINIFKVKNIKIL